jgi:hypothetical protein
MKTPKYVPVVLATTLMRWLLASAKYKLPTLSRAMPSGLNNEADVATVPSRDGAAVPVPANVEMTGCPDGVWAGAEAVPPPPQLHRAITLTVADAYWTICLARRKNGVINVFIIVVINVVIARLSIAAN